MNKPTIIFIFQILSLTLCLADTHIIENTKFQYDRPDKADQKREILLKFYLPTSKSDKSDEPAVKKAKKPAATILLSHGLTGTRDSGTYLAQFWANQGFLVIAMQHPGSDSKILKNVAVKDYITKITAAANIDNFIVRNQDVKATLDKITKWNADKNHFLYQKCDLNKIGIAGHSFGAITSQALTGQNFPIYGQSFTDPRIKAACCLSPSPALLGTNQEAFSKVTTPWLLMTGSADTIPIPPKITVKNRIAVFHNLPKKINSYLVVLNKATHMAFHDTTLLNTPHSNKNHHFVIKKISAAFFSAHLLKCKKSTQWIQSKQVSSILEKQDIWQWK